MNEEIPFTFSPPSPSQIHFTGHFFPWHRSFVHRFERALREECGFTGTQPYWDWTKGLALFDPLGLAPYSMSISDADNFYNSSLFDPNPTSGLGGWGDQSDDFQITTGAFASDFVRPYPAPHPLRRIFTSAPAAGGGFGDGTPPVTAPLNTLFTPQRIKDMVDGFPGDFVGFQKLFEGGNGSHGAIHQSVGGSVTSFCLADLHC